MIFISQKTHSILIKSKLVGSFFFNTSTKAAYGLDQRMTIFLPTHAGMPRPEGRG
jgi:hypothetical protein